MRLKRFIKDVRKALRDPERELVERLFIALTIVSEVVVLIALIADIITRENPGEILVLVLTLILVPTVTFTSMYKNRMKIGIRLIVIGLVFLILPGLFFFGGGIEGGGVIWFVFAFMYVGLILEGIERTVILILLFVLSGFLFLVQYYYPELVASHSRRMFFIDSFISLMMVGLVCFSMSWTQNRFFISENNRAKREAKRAEELNRSQNRFFSSMSHEIRTPINSILGLNELILRDESISDEVARDAAGIQGSGKMLLALINDILDFSKIKAGSMDIVPVDYKVGDMLSEIINMMWAPANDKGLQFEVSVDPQVPAVLFGDEVRIKQVLINLLNNAVKYTARGKISLHLESEPVDDTTTELSIAISDTGMGIKREALPYLFDAFKRVDEEKNRHIEGTGLGLSIVKQLAELMGGTISVNSVYGEGSTFTFTVRQTITDPAVIGELNIHNQSVTRKKAYESIFRAPEAVVLIVDDNEMNLEVESKLLAGTEMKIDQAVSGKEALKMTVEQRYDVILMDHLMPEMDGIECMERIRSQTGGLNRNTPVVVLTANAGSDNIDLYMRSGFDGYLVKPVSGDALEKMLMKHVSQEKQIKNSRLRSLSAEINATDRFAGKAPVIVTSTSMCDLPDRIVNTLRLPLIPFLVHMDDNVFKDSEQMEADELIRFLEDGKKVESSPPDEKAFTEFFAEILEKAHNLIHISLSTSMSDEFSIASEAAKSFDNVTVINSECVSSATGILVLIGCRLVQQGVPAEDIIAELEEVKKRLRCSFIIDKTDYMARNGRVSRRTHLLAKALSLHPSIRIREDKTGTGGAWMGSSGHAYRRYIRRAFPVDIIPDSEVLFITYADVPWETLNWIKDEISRIAFFENVIFVQASAAISANCGPGSFGILYFVKGNKSYNLTTFFENTEDEETEDEEDYQADPIDEAAEKAVSISTAKEEEKKWYKGIEGIDGEAAVKNSGSEEAFRSVLKIFYDSVKVKTDEIRRLYEEGDWENYTIKVHALKSSAKLIGAIELAGEAQRLEDAGKAKDTGYISEHQEAFMKDFGRYEDILAEVFPKEEETDEKPVADKFLMESFYDGLKEAAEAMDLDALEEVMKEIGGYRVPEEEKERFGAVRTAVENFDYDGILDALREE